MFGDPADEIIAAAARMDADMIVMGSRGMGRLGSAILGSVASAVLRSAPCPVLVVREPEDEVAHSVS
jgi:universal stress protein A